MCPALRAPLAYFAIFGRRPKPLSMLSSVGRSPSMARSDSAAGLLVRFGGPKVGSHDRGRLAVFLYLINPFLSTSSGQSAGPGTAQQPKANPDVARASPFLFRFACPCPI